MQIRDFSSIDIKVYQNNILIYEGSVDYASENIKNMTYKDVIPTR